MFLHKLILNAAVSGTYYCVSVACHWVREHLNFPANLCTGVYHSSVAVGKRTWGDACPDAHGNMGNLFFNPSSALKSHYTNSAFSLHRSGPCICLVSWVLKFTWGFQTEHSELTEWWRSELEYLSCPCVTWAWLRCSLYGQSVTPYVSPLGVYWWSLKTLFGITRGNCVTRG